MRDGNYNCDPNKFKVPSTLESNYEGWKQRIEERLEFLRKALESNYEGWKRI